MLRGNNGHFLIFAATGRHLKSAESRRGTLAHVIGPGFCLLVASVDETIQLFVSGRSGQVSDVVLDFVGALCGITLLLIIIKVFGKEVSRF